MLKIGSLQLKNNIISAPMAGVSDKAYRQVVAEMGCGLIFSEMISDMGLIYEQRRTWELADTAGEDVPLALQIFGSSPETIAEGARKLERNGAMMIDINMGCPTAKVVKNGSGASLMNHLELARSIIRAAREAVRIPLSVKMRSGWLDGEESCLQLALIAEEEGADAVTLHPRSRIQFFSGHSDWDLIRRTKELLHIPLIGNGDIRCAEDARAMIQQTGCDAVMIGRGALGNPFLFEQSVALLDLERDISPPEVERRLDMAYHPLDLAIAQKGEAVAVREMRKHIAWYLKGLRAAAKMREAVNRATTRESMRMILLQMQKIQGDE